MLFTEPMKKIELLLLKSDADAVMRYLGFAGCLQLIAEGHEQHELSISEKEIAELKIQVQSLARFLGISESAETPIGEQAPNREELVRRGRALLDATKPLIEEESGLVQRRLTLKQTEDELASFAKLKVAIGDIEQSRYLIFRLGLVNPERVSSLSEKLSKRALIIALDRPGEILAATTKKGRWALDSELKKVDFQEIQFPKGMKGIPSEMLEGVRHQIAATDTAIADLKRRTAAERDARTSELKYLLSHLDLDTTIDTVKQTLAATGSVQRITGWLATRRFTEVSEGLSALLNGRLALRTFDPSELPEVTTGKTKVPVSTPHGPVVRSFERMVFSYSVPLYGTIDPTPFVAVLFLLLFSIMFGDVGQGFVGVVIGLLINSGRIKSFENYRRKHFGTTFLLAGIGSMIAGFLYGSFFANEHVLEPASRWVTTLIVGRPIDHIISLSTGGFQKIILFFGFTIGIGALINSIGLVINIVNLVRRKQWERAFLTKTGLAGALFFWYLLFIGVRVILGGKIGMVDFVALGIPLLALFFREPLVHVIEGHHPILKDGLFAFVMEGIVEILESSIYYISNSVSFLRVAAFALAHGVLSTIVFLLSGMVGSSPGGFVFSILVILIGNSIIIVLEGLIVTIQVVRLQYYEFFSKFFDDTGEEFSPFILRTSGGLR